MPPRPKISSELRAFVRERASSRCEYCHALEAWQYVEFTLEHVVPIVAGGRTAPENLALACFTCNRRKWDRAASVDPLTGEPASLFDPRAQSWNDHFAWSSDGLVLHGLTPAGRATVAALELNRERLQRIREADVALGRHPPETDRRALHPSGDHRDR
ncbi:MAG: HNH endonuclease signature motif containing protein [Byssovorax sp.]